MDDLDAGVAEGGDEFVDPGRQGSAAVCRAAAPVEVPDIAEDGGGVCEGDVEAGDGGLIGRIPRRSGAEDEGEGSGLGGSERRLGSDFGVGEVAVGGPEEGVGEEAPEGCVFEVFLCAEGCRHDACSLVFADPGDGLFRDGGFSELEDGAIGGEGCGAVEGRAGAEGIDTFEDGVIAACVCGSDLGGDILAEVALVISAEYELVHFEPFLEAVRGGADGDEGFTAIGIAFDAFEGFAVDFESAGEEERDIRGIEGFESWEFVESDGLEEGDAREVVGDEEIGISGEEAVGFVFGGT